MSTLLDQLMSSGKRLNLRVRLAQERVRAGDVPGGIAELESVLAAMSMG